MPREEVEDVGLMDDGEDEEFREDVEVELDPDPDTPLFFPFPDPFPDAAINRTASSALFVTDPL